VTRCIVEHLTPFAIERPIFVKRHSRGQGSPYQMPIPFFFCLGAQLIDWNVGHSIPCVEEIASGPYLQSLTEFASERAPYGASLFRQIATGIKDPLTILIASPYIHTHLLF
jgi:hypothetical protein